MNTKAERIITDLREASANLLDRAILADSRLRRAWNVVDGVQHSSMDLRMWAATRLDDAQNACRVLKIDVQDLLDDVNEALAAMGYDEDYRDENGYARPLPMWARTVFGIVLEADYMLISLQAEGLFA